MKLVPGKLVVFEGLDAAGKTTGLQALTGALLNKGIEAEWIFPTHQPSGTSRFGAEIYQLTERNRSMPAMSRQFLHLASHVEHYRNSIIPMLEDGVTVLLDRCWWSTVVYGWYGSEEVRELYPTVERFCALAQTPAQHHMPDLLFYHSHTWSEDNHNTKAVRDGYVALHRMFRSYSLEVPPLSPDETVQWYLARMLDRGICKEDT